MPYRTIPFVTGEVYHVFNRSIAKQPIFITPKNYKRVLEVIDFYRYTMLPMRFSRYKTLSIDQKERFGETILSIKNPVVEILVFSIMPNHVHFLLRQLVDNGISDFMRNFQHSYAKYFNTQNARVGSLFQFMFKAIRIESEEQLLHVSRYIHLNPVTAYLIDITQLESYLWSSFMDYVGNTKVHSFVETKTILSFFKSKGAYRNFVFDQVDYQRELNKIKHLTME